MPALCATLLALLLFSAPVRAADARAAGPTAIQQLSVGAAIAPRHDTAAHRAMHDLLEARYGVRTLPAWFVEGLAAYAQPQADREVAYWRALRARPRHLNSLDGLVSVPYASPPPHGACAQHAHGEQYALFAAQSLTLVEFLAEMEGPQFLARVADAMAQGRDLASSVAGARTLHSDPQLLEAQWFAWLRARGVQAEIRLRG